MRRAFLGSNKLSCFLVRLHAGDVAPGSVWRSSFVGGLVGVVDWFYSGDWSVVHFSIVSIIGCLVAFAMCVVRRLAKPFYLLFSLEGFSGVRIYHGYVPGLSWLASDSGWPITAR